MQLLHKPCNFFLLELYLLGPVSFEKSRRAKGLALLSHSQIWEINNNQPAPVLVWP